MQSDDTPNDATMNVAELAFELGVSYQAAHRLVLTRQIAGARKGRGWRVSRASVDEYKRRANPTSLVAA